MSRTRRTVLFIASMVVTSGLLAAVSGAAAAPEPADPAAGEVIKDAYVVVLAETQPEEVDARVKDLLAKYPGKLEFTYRNSLQGYSVFMDPEVAKQLSQAPDVASVTQQTTMWFTGEQADAPWGLGLIDQRISFDDVYRYGTTGAGVHAYVVDSGIRQSHVDFEGRASGDINFVPQGVDRWGTNDCNGHGTGMAGIIGGRVHGVAKQVHLHTVRVGGCLGGPSVARFLAAMEWLVEHARRPAVVNLSLQGLPDANVDAAVADLIRRGITVVASAGNSDRDACGFSPTRVPGVITVGAIDALRDRPTDTAWGHCVDIFAPGHAILTATNTSDTATGQFNVSTSAATAFVTGAVARYLERFPDAWPGLVAKTLKDGATKDQIPDPNGSPNLILYLDQDGPGNDGFAGTSADVNGDGRDDIVTFTRGDLADVKVALSTGTGFGVPTRWHGNVAGDSHVPLLGDVNGDGRDDLISFSRGSSADVHVALSTGHSFDPTSLWHTWFAAGNEIPAVGDVNGDGRDDIVTFTRGSSAKAYVALSNGTQFVGTGVVWSGFVAHRDAVPMVGDVNCDGRDDVVWFSRGTTGNVAVATSTGSSFEYAGIWESGFALGIRVPMVADFNGDGCADVAEISRGTHSFPFVQVAISAPAPAPRTGRTFAEPTMWHTHFAPGEPIPGAGDFTGDGRDDLVYFTRGGSGDVFVAASLSSNRFSTSVLRWNDWFAFGLEIPMPASTW